jgi:hypothetical protein
MSRTKLQKDAKFEAGVGTVITTKKPMTDAILVRVPDNETVLVPAMGLLGKTPELRNARLARIRSGEERMPALIVHEEPTAKGARAIEQGEFTRRQEEAQRKAQFAARQAAEVQVKELVGKTEVRTGTITEFKTNEKGRYGAIITVVEPVSGMVHVSNFLGGSQRLESLSIGDPVDYLVVAAQDVPMRKGRAGQTHLNVSLSELAVVFKDGAHFSHAQVIKDTGKEIILRADVEGHSQTLVLVDDTGIKNRASLTKNRNQHVAVDFAGFDERGRVLVTKA